MQNTAQFNSSSIPEHVWKRLQGTLSRIILFYFICPLLVNRESKKGFWPKDCSWRSFQSPLYSHWEQIGAGVPPGLQNQPLGVSSVLGGFDSHTFPPPSVRAPKSYFGAWLILNKYLIHPKNKSTYHILCSKTSRIQQLVILSQPKPALENVTANFHGCDRLLQYIDV